MDRQPPRALSDELDLYIRTYYSLLRSSGDVLVRAFEEAHMYSESSLHAGARDAAPDVAAFAYSAARLPACMPQVQHVVLGQSHEQLESAGFDVQSWQRVRTRGRRRPLFWDGQGRLAAFVTSTSDIDDLVPILAAYQIEWNKLHRLLAPSEPGRRLAAAPEGAPLHPDPAEIGQALGLSDHDLATLRSALDGGWASGLREIALRPSDRSIRLLAGSLSQYQRAAHRWWSGIEPAYLREAQPRRRPVYFVSSNMHSLTNLLGGYALTHREEIREFARRRNPEDLAPDLERAIERGDEHEALSLTYYLLRAYLHDQRDPARLEAVQKFDAESGILSLDKPGNIDVGAQLIELSRLRADRLDPRLQLPGLDRLARSDAVILNIDYPLGMAAYHHLSRLAQGVGDLRGVYLMGKAATLNARIGDVMIPGVVHDEHSQNTYLLRNAFAAGDVQPWVRAGSVFDNQKALSVRGPFLQNRRYMSVIYKEGYTVLEMEAGPYLSALYEIVSPKRHPNDEIVHLAGQVPFDVGVLHYVSDTPYSRRQSLLSKSLSYFGVDSTYGCAVAILQRILRSEIERLA